MVHYQTEVVMALNTNGAVARGADVTVDATKHPAGSTVSILYQSDCVTTSCGSRRAIAWVIVTQQSDGRVTVRVDLPPAGMMILA